MANKREILGSKHLGAEMLESEAVREIFTLRRLGWGIKRIARELGLARNTVRDWLRNGANRTYATPAKGTTESATSRISRCGDVIRRSTESAGCAGSAR